MASVVEDAPAWRPPAFDEDDPQNYKLSWLPRNDAGNADRMRERFGSDLIYVLDVGWHWWDGKRWSHRQGEIMANRLAHETVKCLYDECTALQDAAGDKKVPRDVQQDHFKWANSSGNAQRINSMLSIVRHYLIKNPTDLDADLLLLNLANGSLRLEGTCDELQPHRREDYATKIIDVDFDPRAKCPLFLSFIEEILPDRAVRDFVQRSFGYAMTGLIGEQVMWFFHGLGANGKSVLVDLIARIMGPYSMSLPFTSLQQDDKKRGSEASPDLARLPGSRLVRASEPEKGARFSEATIKMATGGEELTVRHLNHGFFDFVPQFKLFVSGNHKPIIRGQDLGIWRRINLVPFTVTIPDERKDKKLPQKLWLERSGILNWLIEGFLHWQEDGLSPPEAVTAATALYREESDALGPFMATWTEPGETARVQAKRLYDAYCLWCVENAAEPVSNTLFGRMLSERGIDKDRSGVVTYRGIQLAQPAVDALDERDRKRHSKRHED